MKTHEWAVVFLVLGFLAFLCVTTQYTKQKAKQILQTTPVTKTIYINLSGCIEDPGVYSCAIGTSLGELLKQVKLKPSADRKKIFFKKILLCDQKIEIPDKNVSTK